MRALIRLIALALVLLSGPALAQRSAGAGAPDPLSDNLTGLNFPPNYDTLARSTSTVTQGVDTTKKNLVLITAGQSNIINTAPTAYVPTNGSKISNLNFNDGGIYTGLADKLLGCGTNNQAQTAGCTGDCNGNVALRIADDLITAGKFDRVIIAPIGIGSTSVADWATGSLSNPSRIKAILTRLAAKGITTSTTNVTIVILWGQGETDKGNATTQVAYTASFNAMVTGAGALATGVKWFVAKQTYISGGVSAAVQAAQTAASPSGVINNASGIYAGPDADSMINNTCGVSVNQACRTSDHFLDNGNITYSAGWQTALHTALPALF